MAKPQKHNSDQTKTTYRFRKHDTIGANDALEDEQFLKDCFVDTGELGILQDTSRPECIVLGRTGSGKTALLEVLHSKEERVAILVPDNLSLAFLSNNQALKFYMEVGIDLDLFFRVLWRHIFVIEIIKWHNDIRNDGRARDFFSDLRQRFLSRKSDENARNYLLRHEQSFFKDTEERVTEYTETLQTNLGQAVSVVLEAAIPGLLSGKTQLGPSIARQLTEEQKTEVIYYGQPVVDASQMRELSEVIDLLKKDLSPNPQKRTYITIDRLDERWVRDDLRYRLIRALFETARDFNRELATVKIIVAIREDLFGRVFRYTRNSGDQEEKYKSLFLRLNWSVESLEELLDKRVNQLIRHHYSKNAHVNTRSLLPTRVPGESNALKYIIDRTLCMPRDLIVFFNECITEAQGKAKITQANIVAAEGRYSEIRLRALADEWSADYPNLLPMAFFLKRQRKSFKMNDIDVEEFETFALNFVMKQANHQRDDIYTLMEEKLNEHEELLKQLLRILFRVGIVGIKKEAYQTTYWSYLGQRVVEAEIDADASFHIHPAFWRVLGIRLDT